MALVNGDFEWAGVLQSAGDIMCIVTEVESDPGRSLLLPKMERGNLYLGTRTFSPIVCTVLWPNIVGTYIGSHHYLGRK